MLVCSALSLISSPMVALSLPCHVTHKCLNCNYNENIKCTFTACILLLFFFKWLAASECNIRSDRITS